MRRKVFLFLGLLTACSANRLTVERYAVLPSELPSVFIDSPDPLKKNPSIGQVLDINYEIKNADRKSMPYLVLLKIIYKNLEEETVSYTAFRDKGMFEFQLLDDKFDATGGILTYKAELMTFDGEMIKDYKHRLWFDLISFE